MQIASKIYSGSTNYSEYIRGICRCAERNDLDNINLTKELRFIQRRKIDLGFILQNI